MRVLTFIGIGLSKQAYTAEMFNATNKRGYLVASKIQFVCFKVKKVRFLAKLGTRPWW